MKTSPVSSTLRVCGMRTPIAYVRRYQNPIRCSHITQAAKARTRQDPVFLRISEVGLSPPFRWWWWWWCAAHHTTGR